MRRFVVLALVVLSACGTFRRESFPEAQKLVGAVAQRYTEITRLTLHAVPTGETECRMLASTDQDRVGRVSDPEDLQAMRSGEEIVLDENGAIDVTVPVLPRQGVATAVVGVTLRHPEGRERAATIARAKEIARAVASAVQNSPEPMW